MPTVARTRAFSMIEMVLVVAIAGITAAVAVPKLSSGFPGSRLAAVENRLIAEFAMVGELARAQGKSHTIQFSITDSEMRVYEGAGAGRGAVIRTIRLSDPPYETTIVSTNITDVAQMITVDGFGIYSATAKVTVSTGGTTRAVTLSAPLAGTPVVPPDAEESGGLGGLLDGLIGGLPILGGS